MGIETLFLQERLRCGRKVRLLNIGIDTAPMAADFTTARTEDHVMKRQPIFTGYDKSDDGPDPFLHVFHKDQYTDSSFRDVKPATGLSTQRLAQFCDDEAENSNRHDFCGAHDKLAKILVRICGDEKANAVMLEIAECGGMHEINCG